MSRRRDGFGLIELIVALLILAIAVLGLAAASVYAHQSFIRAETDERIARTAAAIIDSITSTASPADGEQAMDRMTVRWSVADETPGLVSIELTVDDVFSGRVRRHVFHATHVPTIP